MTDLTRHQQKHVAVSLANTITSYAQGMVLDGKVTIPTGVHPDRDKRIRFTDAVTTITITVTTEDSEHTNTLMWDDDTRTISVKVNDE